jgi:heavy metal sensor kinase
MTGWRWRPASVRVRLTLWYLAALLAALALYATGVYVFVWQSLLADVDRRLHDDVENVGQMVTRAPDGGIAWRPLVQGDHEEAREEAEAEGALMPAIQVWSLEGRLLTQRLSRRTAAVAETLTSAPRTGEDYVTVRLADRTDARTLTRRVRIEEAPFVIRVVRSQEPLKDELDRLLLVLGLGFPIATGLAGGGGYLLARRALSPVGRIAERARTITAERLADRVPVDNPRDELGQLAVVLNDTFARLERSFEQMRRFTADASHELRTPLTAIRSVGEVGLEEPRDPTAYRDVIGNMLEETDRLARLVDSLLLLSRADAGQVTFHRERIYLGVLAGEVAAHLGVLAEEKQQKVRVHSDGPIEVFVDRLAIRQALVNLLDNAIKHGPEGSDVRVEVGCEGPAALLDVVDRGPGIPPEHAPRIFDRFYRVDPARSREDGGAGLGLSIARWAVESHGGTLRLESSGHGETRFRITLPRN